MKIKEHYNTYVFDCDGVVLNSNRVKTDAFYHATLAYGEAAALAMVEHHVANGGVSRYKKFAHFLDQIAPKHAPGRVGPSLDELLQAYADEVREGLLNCDMTSGLEALREKTPGTRWLIVSGGDQTELRDVFVQRGIASWFNGGIYGSPDTKDEILEGLCRSRNIQRPAIFLGDSKYDYQAAHSAGLNFIFLSDWSEVGNWREWVAEKGIEHAGSISELI